MRVDMCMDMCIDAHGGCVDRRMQDKSRYVCLHARLYSCQFLELSLLGFRWFWAPTSNQFPAAYFSRSENLVAAHSPGKKFRAALFDVASRTRETAWD